MCLEILRCESLDEIETWFGSIEHCSDESFMASPQAFRERLMGDADFLCDLFEIGLSWDREISELTGHCHRFVLGRGKPALGCLFRVDSPNRFDRKREIVLLTVFVGLLECLAARIEDLNFPVGIDCLGVEADCSGREQELTDPVEVRIPLHAIEVPIVGVNERIGSREVGSVSRAASSLSCSVVWNHTNGKAVDFPDAPIDAHVT